MNVYVMLVHVRKYDSFTAAENVDSDGAILRCMDRARQFAAVKVKIRRGKECSDNNNKNNDTSLACRKLKLQGQVTNIRPAPLIREQIVTNPVSVINLPKCA